MTTMDLTCQQCAVPFRARQRLDKPRRYCSRPCRDAAQTTRVNLTCRQCGELFQRKAYQKDWSTERGPFCGMSCYGEWQHQNLEGPTAPTWGRETNPNGRGSHRWIRNRALALDRDERQCRECGSFDFLHVHHVVPWEVGQEDPHALDNLVTLCARHHRRAHRALGGR